MSFTNLINPSVVPIGGTGAYEIIRTLLYYYCSERYGLKLKEEGIRLVGG